MGDRVGSLCGYLASIILVAVACAAAEGQSPFEWRDRFWSCRTISSVRGACQGQIGANLEAVHRITKNLQRPPELGEAGASSSNSQIPQSMRRLRDTQKQCPSSDLVCPHLRDSKTQSYRDFKNAVLQPTALPDVTKLLQMPEYYDHVAGSLDGCGPLLKHREFQGWLQKSTTELEKLGFMKSLQKQVTGKLLEQHRNVKMGVNIKEMNELRKKGNSGGLHSKTLGAKKDEEKREWVKCSSCADDPKYAKKCPLYKRKGHCKITHVKNTMCKKTCGGCSTSLLLGGSSGSSCADQKWYAKKCPLYKSMGYCKSRHYKTKCKKTCGGCPTSEIPKFARTPSPTEQEVCRDDPPSIPGKEMFCKRHSTLIPHFCDLVPGALSWCRATCLACDSEATCKLPKCPSTKKARETIVGGGQSKCKDPQVMAAVFGDANSANVDSLLLSMKIKDCANQVLQAVYEQEFIALSVTSKTIGQWVCEELHVGTESGFVCTKDDKPNAKQTKQTICKGLIASTTTTACRVPRSTKTAKSTQKRTNDFGMVKRPEDVLWKHSYTSETKWMLRPLTKQITCSGKDQCNVRKVLACRGPECPPCSNRCVSTFKHF